MYSIKIHFLNLSFYGGDELDQEQIELLDAALSPDEQFNFGYLAKELLCCATFDDMLACVNISAEEFMSAMYVDVKDVKRWQDQNLTSFERDMVVYLLCRYAYEEGRINCCQVCLRPFVVYYENRCLCDSCLGELLLLMDGRKFSLKN